MNEFDIAQRMREVLPLLNLGLGGYQCHLEPECEGDWTYNYAIVKGLWFDWPLDDGDEYETFNSWKFQEDYERLVRKHFPGCRVRFFWGSAQEIEVYRE